jgi:argininosuccinate lyase
MIGNLVTLLTVQKGLAMTYFKDMQEDKEPLFDAAETLALALAAIAGMARDMQPQVGRLAQAAGAGFSTATDLADWLVRELKMPFRDAHHVTGRLVAKAETMGVDLAGLTIGEMQAEEPRIHDGVFGVLSVAASVRSRTSHGGTAPANVAAMAAAWQERLG